MAVSVRHHAREWGHGERVSEGDSEPSTEHGRSGFAERVPITAGSTLGKLG